MSLFGYDEPGGDAKCAHGRAKSKCFFCTPVKPLSHKSDPFAVKDEEDVNEEG